MSTAGRNTDPKWNRCVYQLCAAWNRLGPDATLAALTVLADSEVTAEGLVVLDVAAKEDDEAPRKPRQQQPRKRTRPSGTCSGCGETRMLRGDGNIQQHRLWGFGSSDACDGGSRPPVEGAATRDEGAA